MRAGLKAQVHAVMGKNGVLPQWTTMWGPAGTAQLDSLELPMAYSLRLESLRDLIELYGQGHSVPIDLGLVPATPPAVLFHGTNVAVLKRILDEGLRPMNRHHVHLSTAAESARRVGARRGRPVVLAVDSQLMAVKGITFYVTENEVWLTAAVAPRFLRRLWS